jgi:hypothetical protein
MIVPRKLAATAFALGAFTLVSACQTGMTEEDRATLTRASQDAAAARSAAEQASAAAQEASSAAMRAEQAAERAERMFMQTMGK